MLWLHIGLPKTGSSAIQAYLRRNRQALSQLGLFYAPAPREEDDDWRISSGNGVRLARHLNANSAAALVGDGDPVKGFARRFMSEDHPLSLVSSEVLAGADRAPLARFRAEGVGDRPVRVLALVRDVYGHARSTWLQTVKRGGYAGDFTAFCRDHYKVGQGTPLSVWAHEFGAEAMEVVHYDSIAGDLVPQFLAALGVTTPSAGPAPVVNRSLTVNEAAVLAECNRIHGGSHELARRVSDHLIYRHPERTAARLVDETAAAVIEERFAGEVADLNARYFGGRHVLKAGPTDRDRQGGGGEPTLAEVWRDVAEALLLAYGQETADARGLEVRNLVLRARERLRKNEARAAEELLQRVLAMDPQNLQAQALVDKMQAAAARRSERERERQGDDG